MTGETDREVSSLLAGLFRRSAGKLTATLSRTVGRERIDLVEEVIQETLLTALKTWPTRGVPEKPEAWLFAAARNKLIDHLRREKLQPERLTNLHEQLIAAESAPETGLITDDLLRCMFACCHPMLPREAQATLTLRLVCGFNTREIARMLLINEDATTRRIARAKEQFRKTTDSDSLLDLTSFAERIDAVLDVIYFLLNAGHTAPEGNLLIRTDLADEALYLATVLSENELTTLPKLFALRALIHFHLSRMPARTNADGQLLTLEEQDRALWDTNQIAEGQRWLEKSASGDQLTEYHLQAGIAAVHAAAKSYAETNWKQIVEYYDMLAEINSSPVIALNRAVAVAMFDSPKAALTLLDELETTPRMAGYYLFHAVRADLLRRQGNWQEAADAYRRAAALAGNEIERAYLQRRIAECPTE